MKKFALAIAAAALCCGAFAQDSHYVAPHVTHDGTFVQGHMQTNPDSTRLNNWSTEGNVNPYTGQAGTVNPYPQPSYPQPSRGSMYDTPSTSGSMYQLPTLPRSRY